MTCGQNTTRTKLHRMLSSGKYGGADRPRASSAQREAKTPKYKRKTRAAAPASRDAGSYRSNNSGALDPSSYRDRTELRTILIMSRRARRVVEGAAGLGELTKQRQCLPCDAHIGTNDRPALKLTLTWRASVQCIR